MHPLMVLIHPLLVLIRGIEGGALASTTGAKAWIGGAHRVEYSVDVSSNIILPWHSEGSIPKWVLLL